MTVPDADRAALADLVHRYAAYVDDRDFGRAAALFTATAELILPDPPERLEPVHTHHGPAGVHAALGALRALARTRHEIVGEVYTGAGADSAAGRIAGTAHHWSARGHGFADVVWHLRYDDIYLRGPEGWRIARRALTVDAITTGPVRRLRP